ncbi:regulator of chromosome condensation 1/beta-lactamase-inhibitor protein II [Phellopilus nigrolimitatus]|nr:regulator of chromosome condensation 1/beta-lactamase-inhibitor protein II [Phellopilus nigrolimitatus]
MAKRLKRSFSPSDASDAPAQKRVRSDDGQILQTEQKTQAEKLPMNDLPLPADHPRPSRLLFVFGDGSFGQLGIGTNAKDSEHSLPYLNTWFETAVQSNMLGEDCGASIEQVCAGGMHNLVIDESGRVWSWGVNDNKALGRQTDDVAYPNAPGKFIPGEILEAQPMLVQKLIEDQFRAVRIAAGDSISVALDVRGRLRAWGCFRSADGLLGFDPRSDTREAQLEPVPLLSLVDRRFVQIACGSDHVLALTQQGTVYGWGNGEHGELGRKLIERRKSSGLVPTRLEIRRIVYVSAGAYHSFAIDESGRVFAWGLNTYRQTGVVPVPDASAESSINDIVWKPTLIDALCPLKLGSGRRVVQISGGEHHSLFLLNDGSVYGCGRCDAFELGLGDDHPAVIAFAECFPSTSSDVSSSGMSASGASAYIGTPTLIPFPPPPTPEQPDPPVAPFCASAFAPGMHPVNPILRIASCSRHNFAVSRSGHAYAWGLGMVGNLGLGDKVELQKTPARVRSREFDELCKDGKNWKWVIEDVTTGGQHTLLVARPMEP